MLLICLTSPSPPPTPPQKTTWPPTDNQCTLLIHHLYNIKLASLNSTLNSASCQHLHNYLIQLSLKTLCFELSVQVWFYFKAGPSGQTDFPQVQSITSPGVHIIDSKPGISFSAAVQVLTGTSFVGNRCYNRTHFFPQSKRLMPSCSVLHFGVSSCWFCRFFSFPLIIHWKPPTNCTQAPNASLF